MIAPIYIDLSGTINEFLLDEEEIKSLSRFVLSRIGREYEQNWEKQINDNLHQTKKEYLQAIDVLYPDDFSLIYRLTDRKSKVPLMIEDGASEFDIKEGFEKSTKKKIKSNGGWYITVPFRHATPEAVAESAIFSSRMTEELENIVKTSANPLKLSDLPVGFREVKTSRVGYKHNAPIYQGLHRRDIGTGNENRGGYYTFRRVSDKSDENSWIHTGFIARKLMDKALSDTNIDYIFDKAVDDFLTKKFS